LVERVLALIREGADVEQLLIVTFTRAAAADHAPQAHRGMMARAEEDPGFAPQLEKVERATVPRSTPSARTS
jgi:superfamily I DNA/RNA helicase